MAKAAGTILAIVGGWFLLQHFTKGTGTNNNGGGGNNNPANPGLTPNPGGVLNYTDLPGDEANAVVPDLTAVQGYQQCLAFLNASDKTSLFRSAWLLISDWVNYTPHVTLAQIALYNHGKTPDNLYAAGTDAFTAIAAILQETPNPAPPSLANINWANPPQTVLRFLTGYQFLSSTDLSTLQLAATHETGGNMNQLLLTKCFSVNKTVWQYLSLVNQLIPTWTQQNNNTGGGGGGIHITPTNNHLHLV